MPGRTLNVEALKAYARTLGFDACGIAAAGDWPELSYFREWVAAGNAGEMEYLRRSAARRGDVRAILPSARSVIALATLYNSDRPYSVEIADRGTARIARYAQGDDYHDVIECRLDRLVDWMRDRSAVPFEARAYVDTGPVQERVYAQYAGIGWIGKNTCLISPDLGSWVFLAVVVCSLDLPADAPALDQCGTCTLCLEACPTGALVEPHRLDATKCLSYLTIELRGAIPEPLRESIGAQVFGCDICQDVCPWNATAPVAHDAAWQPRAVFDRPTLLALWRRTDVELHAALNGSAIRRTKLSGLRRNLAVALGNSGDQAALDALQRFSEEPAAGARHPMVNEHVVWAVDRLKTHHDEEAAP
jgi:epoxyqueuosine reductase